MSAAGKRVAILATDGFEQAELFEPKEALEKSGATVHVVAPHEGEIKAWNKEDWGKGVKVDMLLNDTDPNDYDALLLPGGVMNPDKLRIDECAVDFTRLFVDAKKPVAAICHGPWLLVEANVLNGKTVTSWPSLKTDIENAGGEWVDEEVIVDENLITSRKPADIPAFVEKFLENLA